MYISKTIEDNLISNNKHEDNKVFEGGQMEETQENDKQPINMPVMAGGRFKKVKAKPFARSGRITDIS